MNITGFPIADLGDIDLKVSEILSADLRAFNPNCHFPPISGIFLRQFSSEGYLSIARH